MERCQSESVCTIIFTHPVGNMDELPVNASCEVQREDGVEGHRIYDIRCLVDRLCKDLIADQVQSMTTTEAGDLLKRLLRLLAR